MRQPVMAGIGYPIGRRDDALAAWIDRRHQRQEDYLLAAATDRDPIRGVRHAGTLRHLRCDRLAQRRNAIEWRVLGFPTRNRLDRCLLDMVGRIEIRLAYCQIKDRTPLRFQDADTLRPRRSRGHLDALNAPGETHHDIMLRVGRRSLLAAASACYPSISSRSVGSY